MSFAELAAAHGLVIRHLIADGRWHRVPTQDKPRKRNGAYICDGERGGAVRNWATMESFALFRPDTPAKQMDRSALDARLRQAMQEQARRNCQAAELAADMLKRATLLKPMPAQPWRSASLPGYGPIEAHPYLVRKGFADTAGLVLDGLLLVPMYACADERRLIGMQSIDAEGNKLFIYGSRAKGAIHRIGRAPETWLVEGYATGLSTALALRRIYRRACVLVCFSATNLIYMASQTSGPRFVVADNDESGAGERAAVATGLPWVMPHQIGSDANDLHTVHGIASVCEMLKDVSGHHR